MNIIKLKDQIRPGDDLFNTYLKGKFAYWIQMRYIVPFDFINQGQYVEMESDITKLTGWRERGLKCPDPYYWDLQSGNIEAWVDADGTEDANSLNKFLVHNKFTTDSDLTIDEIKKFRTWLAATLLSFDVRNDGAPKNYLYNEDLTEVLDYYAHGMYNACVKSLNKLGTSIAVNRLTMQDCGCASGANLAGLYNESLTNCDPLYTYRKYIYEQMVAAFSNIEFWVQFPEIFIKEFKSYIDNIIQLNLPLKGSSWISSFVDCTCHLNSDQMVYIETLRRLSQALEYIRLDDVTGHLNFISKALRDWATDLYEAMEWPTAHN